MTEDFSMEEILAQSPNASSGEVVEGTVVSQTDTHLLINVGLKQEAALPLKEFAGAVPAVGDKISLLILRMSGPEGRPLASWRQARERQNWDKIVLQHQNKEIIQGKITQKVKGGYSVDIGLDAFMPASQLDERPVSNPESWIGQTVPVIVLEMDRAKGNVLVSRRKVVEQEKAVKRSATLEQIKEGQVLKGRVTGLTNFGAFVDVGGVEGLLHISDISWTHIDKPQAVLKVGDQIDVKVLKFDQATHRISLSRKQLLPHPWDGIEKKYPIGSLIKGKVTGLADFGAFVQIEPGVEGLIHVSELSWTERLKKPHGVLKAGQEIEAKLIGIDREKEKISLSLKRTGQSPWDKALQMHPIGSKVEGVITHIAAFGAFVKIDAGVEALLKTQDISWTDKIQNPSQALKVGDKITAMVLEVNPQEEKMALGLKQLAGDPMKLLKIGEEVNGVISKVTEFGLFVKLESGIEGLVRSSEIQNDRSMFNDSSSTRMDPTAPAHSYKEGDAITAAVHKVNRKERKVELSIRRYEKAQEKQLLKKYSGENQRLTLGQTTGWEDDK